MTKDFFSRQQGEKAGLRRWYAAPKQNKWSRYTGLPVRVVAGAPDREGSRVYPKAHEVAECIGWIMKMNKGARKFVQYGTDESGRFFVQY